MSLPNYKIPLFDIDWTLLEGGHTIHDDAFTHAYETIYQLKGASIHEVEHNGMIDSQILMLIAQRHGVSEKKAKEKVAEALTAMVDYFMKHADKGSYKVMPGVKELLEELRLLNIPLGLLTGNIEEIGWEKVRRAGIKEYFTFGAFGSLAYKRVDLIPIAKKRLEEILKEDIPLERFVIIGDSPLDIACARAGNIEVIAVAAGVYKNHHLAEADLVVDSLEEKDKILEFLRI